AAAGATGVSPPSNRFVCGDDGGIHAEDAEWLAGRGRTRRTSRDDAAHASDCGKDAVRRRRRTRRTRGGEIAGTTAGNRRQFPAHHLCAALAAHSRESAREAGSGADRKNSLPHHRGAPRYRPRRRRSAVDASLCTRPGRFREKHRQQIAGDLLSMLLSAQDQDGSRMTDRQLRDEAITLFLAGHETTASTLSWTWWLLAQNPEVEAKLHAELDAVLGNCAPSLDDLPRLAYTGHVITESLRLYPAAWGMARLAVEDHEIAGYPVTKGMGVAMAQWVVHRDPRWYDAPQEFL